jgi:hypothetical protein
MVVVFVVVIVNIVRGPKRIQVVRVSVKQVYHLEPVAGPVLVRRVFAASAVSTTGPHISIIAGSRRSRRLRYWRGIQYIVLGEEHRLAI